MSYLPQTLLNVKVTAHMRYLCGRLGLDYTEVSALLREDLFFAGCPINIQLLGSLRNTEKKTDNRVTVDDVREILLTRIKRTKRSRHSLERIPETILHNLCFMTYGDVMSLLIAMLSSSPYNKIWQNDPSEKLMEPVDKKRTSWIHPMLSQHKDVRILRKSYYTHVVVPNEQINGWYWYLEQAQSLILLHLDLLDRRLETLIEEANLVNPDGSPNIMFRIPTMPVRERAELMYSYIFGSIVSPYAKTFLNKRLPKVEILRTAKLSHIGEKDLVDFYVM